MPLGDGGYRIQIRDVQRGVADGLHVQGARPPLTAASILSKSCGFTKRVVIPNWGRMSLNRVNVPPYRLFAETISSPCFSQIDDRRKNGGRTRRRSQRPDTALQQAHTFFQHGLRGVAEPPVDIPLFGKAKKFGGVLRALEEVAAGPVDRDSPRQRRRIRMLPAMNGERFKTDRHYCPPYPGTRPEPSFRENVLRRPSPGPRAYRAASSPWRGSPYLFLKWLRMRPGLKAVSASSRPRSPRLGNTPRSAFH